MCLKRAVKAVFTGALGTVLLAVPVTPAHAHETSLYYGQSYAYVGPGHSRIVWCDSPADSSAVRAWYYTNNWHTTREVWAGGCGEWRTDHQITSYCLEVINVTLLCRTT